MKRQALFLCASLVAVLAALGPSGSAAQNASALPDFSGVWSHPYLTGMEPPASGPGPVRNSKRRPDGTGNFQQLVGDYTNPILKPEAAAEVKRHGEISLSGEGYPTPSNQCWPPGVPYVFWDFLVQVFQRPDHVTMVYRQGDEVRRVRLNASHPARVIPSYYGDSVGHYDGDTLVVDTVGFKKGPFPMIDMYGTPFTDKLHVVERYRMVDYDAAKGAMDRNAKENSYAGTGWDFDRAYRGKVLQLQFTVEDEGVFTMPWTSTITYRPAIYPWPELICAENPGWYPGKESAIPRADKPDF
jgi:hypothetical protein